MAAAAVVRGGVELVVVRAGVLGAGAVVAAAAEVAVVVIAAVLMVVVYWTVNCNQSAVGCGQENGRQAPSCSRSHLRIVNCAFG